MERSNGANAPVGFEAWQGASGAVRRVFLLFVLAGAASRFYAVNRPYDANTLNAWREADYTLVARAFYRESMDIFAPRIAWRGDTSGLVEMEFPFLPWTAAALYHVFGEREMLLRLLSSLAGGACVLAFAMLAWRLLPPLGAWVAVGLLAINPLLLSLGGSMQPEPLTLFLVILTMSCTLGWQRTGRGSMLLTAGGVTAAAILSKSPAAYVGLVLAWAVLRRMGMAALGSPTVWVAGLIALVPPLLWYWHAHGHYVQTGLSLGVSNEAHFLNPTLIVHPKGWILGNAQTELRFVFGGFGLLLALATLVSREWRRRCELALVWYAAVLVFYVVSANTSGDAWAFYYHCHSVPPACLLMGAGLAALVEHGRGQRVVAVALGTGTFVVAGWVGVKLMHERFNRPALQSMAECLPRLAQAIPPEGRIIVRGGESKDWTGRPVAYNASMAFVWMDRQGSNYPSDQLSIERIRSLASDRHWYWVAQPADLNGPTLNAKAREAFPVVSECNGFVLFEVGNASSDNRPE